MLSDDPEQLLKVKGCLWAVGNVGSMELGAPFLEESDVVENIVKIAESHEVMSLRGTAFFVLGLISRSIHGLEILSENGWESNTNTMGASLGLCIPKNLRKLFSFQPWKHETASSLHKSETQKAVETAARVDDDLANNRILELIQNLSSPVLKKTAVPELLHLKSLKAPGFKQVALWKKVMTLFECHQLRLKERRFALDLFDKSILRHIVLDEESSDEDGDEESAESDASEGSGGRTERQRSISDASSAT